VQQAPLYHIEAHITRNLDRAWWVSADAVYFMGGATSTDGISNHNYERSLALAASLGTQVGEIYLKATYGHVVERNEDGLYKKGIRLLAVYAF
jgi:adenylylsulfate kinase-like enzyme